MWPPTVADIRAEVTSQKSDAAIHRILQAAVDVVASYGLSEDVSSEQAIKLAVVDTMFDGFHMTTPGAARQMIKQHEMSRRGVLVELSRLAARKARGYPTAGPAVPAVAAAPANTGPVLYLTYAEWQTRARSYSLPIGPTGAINQSRVEALLADASAWCLATAPDVLTRGGGLIPIAELPPALLSVCRLVCMDLVALWVSPRTDRWAEDQATCEERNAVRLRDIARASAT